MRNLSFKARTSRILPCLCLLDILLFPYIRFLSCSVSMLLLLGWYFMHPRFTLKQKALLGVSVLVIISLLIGYSTYHKLLGLSAGIIFIFSFMLCFFFKNEFHHKTDLIPYFQKLLEFYLYTAFVFVLIYIINPSAYFSLRSFWTMGGTEIEFSTRTINRFTFLFSDPNNAGCMFISIMAYLMMFGPKAKKKQVIYAVVGSVCTLATFSVTAVGMLIAVFLLLAATKIRKRKWLLHSIVILAVVFLLLIVAISLGLLDGLFASEMVTTLLWRIETNTESRHTLGGRTSLWKNAINSALSWYNIVIGKGAVADAAGVQYSPHSGHLFMLISFGAISNLLFYAKQCFLGYKAKWKNYIPLLPCFAIFTINTGFTDYRFMVLYACLFTAIYVTLREEKRKAAVLLQQHPVQ